ncbi:hypothetical protein ELE36_00575 [Pseudolysobacter antarcticus]|uniref:Delta-60 repeat domain-containing protein n=1 Tax=Pseudolysobacter antarcticus TaxID=2511995 RepID=A0A411HET1_9GAMM|nr:delta-60 repeat domain-containing protein [Pseudolysobacter antarcticus]QBB68992.1 hypothetical protein ELE36_00575 [Pseudolysobacter antarcticus]
MNKPIHLFSLFCFALTLGCQSTAQAALEGDLDPTFNGGQVRTVYVPYNNTTDQTPTLIGFSTVSTGYLAAIRIGTNPSLTVQLVKILKDGTLAQNFGINGVRDLTEGQVDWAAMTAISGPDTIILGGSKILPGSNGQTYTYHVERLNSYGTLDSTFNGNTGFNDATPSSGTTGEYDYVGAIVVQPSTGQIIIAGTSNVNDGKSQTGMGVIRLNGNGTTDTSFGTNGGFSHVFLLNGGKSAHATSIALDSQAHILIGGYAQDGTGSGAHYDFALLRVTSAGVLDSCPVGMFAFPCTYTHAFQIGGKFNDFPTNVLVDQTGKIYMVGQSSAATDGSGNDLYKSSILRLTNQLQPDSSFSGNNGAEAFYMQSGGSGETDVPPSALVDASNRLMVTSGYAFTGVARFVTAGTFDSSYNNGTASSGRVVAIANNATSYALPAGQPSILLEDDRPVVAAITLAGTTGYNLSVTRLLGDKIFQNGFQ